MEQARSVTSEDDLFAQNWRNNHGPDWRWRLAHHIVEQRSRRLSRQADRTVRRLAGYIRRCRRSQPNKIQQHYAEYAAAEAAWSDSDIQQQFQIMVLGALPPEEISKRLGLSLPTVAVLEECFFAVREMHEHTSWVHTYVIRSAPASITSRFRLTFHGGPAVTRAILEAEEHVPFEREQQIADKRVLLSMKLRQALEMPLGSPKNVLRFLQLHMEYEHGIRRLQLEERRLLAQIESIGKQHELTQMRMQAQQERAKQRESAKQRRTQKRQQKELFGQEVMRMRAALIIAREQTARERVTESELAKLTWETERRKSSRAAVVIRRPMVAAA